jgi:TolB protein
MLRFKWFFALLLAVVLQAVQAPTARALTIDIYGPGQRQVNVCLLAPVAVSAKPGAAPHLPDGAERLENLMRQDLSFLPFIKLMASSDILGSTSGATAKEIDFHALTLAQADLAVSTSWIDEGRDMGSLELRLFETFSGRRILGKAYANVQQEQLPLIADRFCSLVMQALTGKSAFFTSRLAYVKEVGHSKEIYTVGPQGRGQLRVTRLGGKNLSPAWSFDGRKLAFTVLTPLGHRLGIWDRATGRIDRKNLNCNTVISPAFLPDGHIAVALDLAGRTSIYLLSDTYEPSTALTSSRAIDVSPSFSSDGAKMAFASGRYGSPLIFLLDMKTKEVRRVTFKGKYNTSPSMSPDGRFIAYSSMLPEGHRIFVHDLATGRDTQVSFGPGNDEEPTFGPDGYFIAFSSSRSGVYQLYLTTRHGDAARRIPVEGPAFSPAWGDVDQLLVRGQ